MKEKRVADHAELKHRLYTRVNDEKYHELRSLLALQPHGDMSSLLRDILHNRPLKLLTKDKTLDNVMEELARIRGEIRSIGVNINQITHRFNTYPEPQRKALYAKVAFEQYQVVQPKIDALLLIVSQLAKRWLSE